MINVTEQINAVRRQVGTRVLEAGEARTMTVSQCYDAPLDDVWDACTNAERIPRWFLPITGDLRLGGHYQLAGNASGKVERCDPPRSFAATWEFGGMVSWIEVRLTTEPGGTRLELEHIAHVDDDMAAQYGPGAVGIGWDLAFVGMAIHLTLGAAVTPEQGQEWVASEEGRQFIALSSDRWRQASVDAGTDPAAAQAAADRARAFFTGELGEPVEPGQPAGS